MTCTTCTGTPLKTPTNPTPAAKARHTRNQAALAHIASAHRATHGTWEVWMRAHTTLPAVPVDIDPQDLAPLLPHPTMIDLLEDAEDNADGTTTFHFTYTIQVDACEDTYEQAALEAMHDDGYPADHFTCDHDYSEFQGTDR